MTNKKPIVWCAILLSLTMLGGCRNAGDGPNASPNLAPQSYAKPPVQLRFMYWGGKYEQVAIEQMIRSFNESHPGIVVKGEYVPGDFSAKINTLAATKNLPDISYLPESLALRWGEQKKLLDLTPYLAKYPELQNRSYKYHLHPKPGSTVGTLTSVEITSLFYNKDLFEEAGIPLPPDKAEEAWTWDEFVKTAIRLTKDSNGKHPDEPGFNPANIVQYGVSIPNWWPAWIPLVESNGGAIANEAGTEYTLDKPEAVEVFQALQDLIYVHHVAPNEAQQKMMPGTSLRLKLNKAAMVIDGQWTLMDIANTSGLNYGIGVLPKFKQPTTVYFGGATSIFSTTEHPEEAIQFYLYHNDPTKVSIHSMGLWMPLEDKYYTDPASTAIWTDNRFHPPEYREAVVDYTLLHSVKAPSLELKNFMEINEAMEPVLSRIWTNESPADKVLKELKARIQPLLAGKYPEK